MRKNRIRLNESQLHRIIKESVKNVLNELQGGSAAPGTTYDYMTGRVTSSQGGAFGHNASDDADAEERARQNQEALRQQQAQTNYREWCYNHYNDCIDMCPGYFRSGEYKKCYDYMRSMGYA